MKLPTSVLVPHQHGGRDGGGEQNTMPVTEFLATRDLKKGNPTLALFL